MRIDIHAHFITPLFYEAIERIPGIVIRSAGEGAQELRLGGTTFLPRKDAWFAPDDCLHDMDKKGIDIRALSLTAPNIHIFEPAAQPALAKSLNDAMFDYCARHPDRFRALACLPLADIPAALAELERVRTHPLFVGIAMGSRLDKLPMNHASMEPVWARLNELRIPVVEHPNHPANTEGMEEYELPIRVGFMFETTVALTRMIYAGIFERYPDFPYIVAHTGAALLVLMERLDNGYRIFADCRRDINKLPSIYVRRLYFDSCAFAEDVLMLAYRTVGVERILFGTDYPYLAHTDTSHVERLPIAPAEREAILGGNAARLFGIGSR
jgi:aminocarboxymuconate-semialdehyde decarboxylase